MHTIHEIEEYDVVYGYDIRKDEIVDNDYVLKYWVLLTLRTVICISFSLIFILVPALNYPTSTFHPPNVGDVREFMCCYSSVCVYICVCMCELMFVVSACVRQV